VSDAAVAYYTENHGSYKQTLNLPWRRCIVIIASASKPADRGFKTRQGVSFLVGICILECCCSKLKNALLLCVFEENDNFKKYILKE
jgi:hypothetical protein